MQKPLGSGYSIKNCPDIHDPENVLIIDEIVKEAKIIRLEVIATAIDIDSFMGELIAIFFFAYDDTDKYDLFKEAILEKEYFSFSKKRDVLQILMKKHPEKFNCPSEDWIKKFFSQIDYVMTHRNAFAHGEMVIDFEKRTAFIYHMKRNPYPLTPEFLKNFQSRIQFLSMSYMCCNINLAIKLQK